MIYVSPPLTKGCHQAQSFDNPINLRGNKHLAGFTTSMTILIIDDDQKFLTFLKRALTKAGYTVITSDNARDALSILVHTPINLMLVDIVMPDIDGNEFCQIVRSDPALEYVPIIFLSALSSVDDMATGIISGADDYLTKPVRLETLLEIIEEYAM